MNKIKVLHQVIDPTGIGGVTAEYLALSKSKLSENYEFCSMIMKEPHRFVDVRDIRFYYKRIKEERPDIIHVRGASLDCMSVMIASRIYGKAKVMVAVHGMYSDKVFISPLKRWFCDHVIERAIFGLADGISCVCKHVSDRPYFRRYQKKMLPFVYNRMPLFDNSKACEDRREVRTKYNIGESEVVGIYLGRITNEKGIDDMLSALDIIEDLSNFTLLMVGNGDCFDYYQNECRDKKYSVVFTGTQSDISKYYHAADFFIMPSLHENHSISLLEACVANLPTVATDCGGCLETIENNVTGLVVPVGDIVALGDAVNKMLDTGFRQEIKDNLCKADYTRFSNDSCDNMLDHAYKALLEK